MDVPLDQIAGWGLDEALPDPVQQADNLILWIGDHQANQAEDVTLDARAVSAWIGAPVSQSDELGPLSWLLGRDTLRSLIAISPRSTVDARMLTLAGWTRYRELKSRIVESKTVFMAMKFGDEEILRVVQSCFKPAVLATGFTLKALNEGQPAGSIDDQLRVAIRVPLR